MWIMRESHRAVVDADEAEEPEEPGLRAFMNQLYLAVNNGTTMRMTSLPDYYVDPIEMGFLMHMYVSQDPLFVRKH
jgi:hypothetical protein